MKKIILFCLLLASQAAQADFKEFVKQDSTSIKEYQSYCLNDKPLDCFNLETEFIIYYYELWFTDSYVEYVYCMYPVKQENDMHVFRISQNRTIRVHSDRFLLYSKQIKQ